MDYVTIGSRVRTLLPVRYAGQSVELPAGSVGKVVKMTPWLRDETRLTLQVAGIAWKISIDSRQVSLATGETK